MVLVAVIAVKQIQMVAAQGRGADNSLKVGIFAQDPAFGFAEGVIGNIDFQAFTGAALLAYRTEIHRSETTPASEYQRFAVFFASILDDFIVDGLGVFPDIGTRLVKDALFDYFIHRAKEELRFLFAAHRDQNPFNHLIKVAIEDRIDV